MGGSRGRGWGTTRTQLFLFRSTERMMGLPCSTALAVPSEHRRHEPCLYQVFFPIL